MMDLKLGNLLLEMRKNYTEQPVFLFTEKGETAKPVMYPDFLADLDENVKVLQQPINSVYIASNGMASLISAIGALDRVKLVATEQNEWYIDDIAQAMANGEIAYSGNYKEMLDDIGKELKFTSLRYHRLDDMIESVGLDKCRLCTYCWDGKE